MAGIPGIGAGAGRVVGGRAAARAAAREAGRAAMGKINPGTAAAPNMLARTLERAWQANATWDLLNRLAGSVLPSFSHGCTVTVRGGPNADLRRVWFLCCASAFGRMSRSPAVAGDKAMTGEWDVSGKVCRIELAYVSNVIAQALEEQKSWYKIATTRVGQGLRDLDNAGVTLAHRFGMLTTRVRNTEKVERRVDAGDGGAFRPGRVPRHFIQAGPDQVTVGNSWPDFLLGPGQSYESYDNPDPTEGNGLVRDPLYRVTLPPAVGGFLAALVRPAILAEPRYNIVSTNSDYFARNLLREWPILAGEPDEVTFLPHRVVDQFGNPTVQGDRGSVTTNGWAPALPDDGRLITTGEKTHPAVQPPRPIIDGATRTSLLALVAQSLTEPCFLPDAPLPTATPWYSSGTYVTGTGMGLDFAGLSRIVNKDRPQYGPTGGDENPRTPSDQWPDMRAIPIKVEDARE